MKSKQAILFLLLCLFLGATNIFAFSLNHRQIKAQIQSEELSLKSSRIKPHTEHYISFIVRAGKKQVLSFLTRTIETIEHNSVPALRITQRYDSASGASTDISIVNRQTLKPLTYEAELSTQTESFNFTGNQVTGSVKPKQGEAKEFNETFETPVFNAVILNEILQSLPLSPGKSLPLQLYNPGKSLLKTIFQVINSEKIQMEEDRLLDTWVIEMQGGAAPTTYWITKQTQEVIMSKSILRDGGEFWRVKLFTKLPV